MTEQFRRGDTVYFNTPSHREGEDTIAVPGVVQESFDDVIRVELARKKRGNWTYEFRAVNSLSLSRRLQGTSPMDSQRLPLSFPSL